MSEELYTRIFVDTQRMHSAVLRTVAEVLGGQVDGWTVRAGDVEVDVRKNSDALAEPSAAGEDAFLHFPLTAEVVTQTLSLEAYLSRVAAIMERLHQDGAKVVAACDWEEQLPGGGKLGV